MNTNFNTFFKKSITYLIAIVAAYVLATIIFVFLPKSGVDFVEESNSSLSYQKYQGFYSRVAKVNKTPKIDRKINKKLENLKRYKLKAIYSTTDNGGWIIVEGNSSKKSTILQQFEKFQGYTLTKLFKNYVIFEKNLEEYKLELPKEKLINYEIENSSSNLEEKIVVKEDSVSITRKYLNGYVNNLNKVWDDINIKQVQNDDKLEGFKINSIEKNSVFSKLGFKSEDIIKSVNGKSIKSSADIFRIYNEINKLDFLSFEVLRNNELMELNYEIN